MKLVISEPGKLTTQEKILEFGLVLKKHTDKLKEFDKQFREQLDEFMEREGVVKIENDHVSIIRTKSSVSYKHDVETIMDVLGNGAFEYLKVDNNKINKELNKIGFNKRPKFSPEQINELENNSIQMSRPGNIRITIKKEKQ